MTYQIKVNSFGVWTMIVAALHLSYFDSEEHGEDNICSCVRVCSTFDMLLCSNFTEDEHEIFQGISGRAVKNVADDLGFEGFCIFGSNYDHSFLAEFPHRSTLKQQQAWLQQKLRIKFKTTASKNLLTELFKLAYADYSSQQAELLINSAFEGELE